MKANTERDTNRGDVKTPVTSLTISEDQIRIVIEMPGISEESIRIQLEKTLLTVSAYNGDTRYFKDMRLPCEPTILRKKFGNDTLELILSMRSRDS